MLRGANRHSGSPPMPHANYGSVKVGDVDVFYREAGPKDGPLVLLLHGFPTSSHMFRDLSPLWRAATT